MYLTWGSSTDTNFKGYRVYQSVNNTAWTAIGSPNVTVNGGPLAFVAPLMAASCTDLIIVPNAATNPTLRHYRLDR